MGALASDLKATAYGLEISLDEQATTPKLIKEGEDSLADELHETELKIAQESQSVSALQAQIDADEFDLGSMTPRTCKVVELTMSVRPGVLVCPLSGLVLSKHKFDEFVTSLGHTIDCSIAIRCDQTPASSLVGNHA